MTRENLRNIAIIAHVDHGKTTLVDQLLKQAGTFRDNQQVAERVMDSNDLEREKGITIMAKNTAVRWQDYKLNIVDTPGHSDFGGEVERILSMVDGVILLVDSAEGPLPQTKFVLKKAFELKLTPIVVINKIDRSDARPDEVLNEVMELFLALGADYDQLNFPVIYAIGKAGIAKRSLDDPNEDLTPLFETIVKTIPGPPYDTESPFQMIITALDWSDYLGRIGVGRIHRGKVKVGDNIVLLGKDNKAVNSKITKMYAFEGLQRTEITEAESGEIICLSGFDDVKIGDTFADPSAPERVPYVEIDEPTLAMYYMVNNSPFAGKEGKHVTTPKLRERLYRELRTNVAMRVEDTDSPDTFKVSGRGELQMAILIETMRREGFEFSVSKPEVLMKRNEQGQLMEPMEHVVIDCPETSIGSVIENLGRRRGEMTNMIPVGTGMRAEFMIPARGLIGFRTDFMTLTRGEGLIHHNFAGYAPFKGEVSSRLRGALVAMETGVATAYSLESTQERGVLFIEPGTPIYEGMIVGENSREDDLSVNPCKAKHLTNMRASGSDGIVKLNTPRLMSLEQFIEFIEDDELLEVTPLSLRIRKKILNTTERQRASKRAKQAMEAEVV
ncbi:MAG: translational GTPase TypA [Candidatus Kapabacteria bacterium]|nr:translational GTPase TypA [Candidatus Kapabacteria bacterium]